MFRKIIYYIKEIKNKKLLFAWLFCILIVIILSLYYKDSSGFLGLADTKEIFVNYEKAATLKRINVQQGQKIKEGDFILELELPVLEIEINTISSEMQELSAQYNLNKKLKIDNSNILQNQGLQKANAKSTDPLNVRIAGLKKQLDILQGEKQKLSVYSKVNGTICSVNYHVGEKITPYTSIVSICPESPTMVTGYIHENLYSRIKIGQKVVVQSLADNSKFCEGQIKVAGSRIVLMPEHIQKIPRMPIWAREVLIEIPHKNSFLLGEKVSIEIKGYSFINNIIFSILH